MLLRLNRFYGAWPRALAVLTIATALTACGGGGGGGSSTPITNPNPTSSLAQSSTSSESSLPSQNSSSETQSSQDQTSSQVSSQSQGQISSQGSSQGEGQTSSQVSSQSQGQTSSQGQGQTSSQSSTSSSGPAPDTTPPEVSIIFPGAVSASEEDTLIIRGIGSDASGIASLTVTVSGRKDDDGRGAFFQKSLEGDAVTTDNNFQDWQAKVELSPGYNLITVTATDVHGNTIEGADPTRIERIAPGADWTGQTSAANFNGISDYDVTPDGALAYAISFGGPVARVDLETGSSTYAFHPYFPYAGDLLPTSFRILTLDSSRNLLYVAEAEGRIYTIDIASGAASPLTAIDFGDVPLANEAFDDGTDNAEGVRQLKYDPVYDRLLVLVNRNGGEIWEVDLTTESRTANRLVEGVNEEDVGFIDSASRFAFDFALREELLYVKDAATNEIVEINVSTGTRNAFLLATEDDPLDLSQIGDIALDPADDSLVVITRQGQLVKFYTDRAPVARYIDTENNSADRVVDRTMTLARNGRIYLSLKDSGEPALPQEIFILENDEAESATQLSRVMKSLTLELKDLVYDAENHQVIIHSGRFSDGISDRTGLLVLDPERAGLQVLAADIPTNADVLHPGAMEGKVYFVNCGASCRPLYALNTRQGYSSLSEPEHVMDIDGALPLPRTLATPAPGVVEIVFFDAYSPGVLYRHQVGEEDAESTAFFSEDVSGWLQRLAAVGDTIYILLDDALYGKAGNQSPQHLGTIFSGWERRLIADQDSGVLYLHDGPDGCGFYRATLEDFDLWVAAAPGPNYCGLDSFNYFFTIRDDRGRFFTGDSGTDTVYHIDSVTGAKVVLLRNP